MITYEINPPITVEEFTRVMQESTLAERRPLSDPVRVRKMLDNADVTVVARDGEHIVGIARALTDYAYCCYLSDLAVAESHQRQGIGKQLMRKLKDYLGDEVTLILVAAPKARDYYPHVGFERIESSWMIARTR